MELSKWLVAGIIELYFVLLILCLFLILNIKSLRKLVRGLRDKIKGLIEELNQARSDNRELSEQKALAELQANPAPTFREQLQKQIDLTQEFHDELPGSQSIESYLDPVQPIQRQSLAFRHAILSAELEAQDVDDDIHPNWALLQNKFGKLINFYKSKFALKSKEPEQTLVNGTEQCVHDLLIEAAGGLAPDNLEVLLDRYRASARDDIDNGPPPIDDPGELNDSTTTANSAQDLASLKALAEKQRQTILELQKRIAHSSPEDDLKPLISDLNSQLSRQERFLKESESCIKLLEDELEMANAKIEQLKHQKRSSNDDTDKLSSSQRQELIRQNEQLLSRVKQQDAEIDQLLAQINVGSN